MPEQVATQEVVGNIVLLFRFRCHKLHCASAVSKRLVAVQAGTGPTGTHNERTATVQQPYSNVITLEATFLQRSILQQRLVGCIAWHARTHNSPARSCLPSLQEKEAGYMFVIPYTIPAVVEERDVVGILGDGLKNQS